MPQQKQRLTTLALLFTLATTFLQITIAQEPPNTTPTIAPSKTPTNTDIRPTTQPEPRHSEQGLEPLTQTDLSTLTGNIQRPNGLFWFDNKLYAACTGDWTLYEIDLESQATVQYIFGVRNAHSMFVERLLDNGEVNLWIPDFQTNTLAHINRNGLNVTASNLNGPWGITPLNETQFLITNLLGNNVSRITRTGQIQEALTHLRSPAGIASDQDYIYVANSGSARRAIEWYPSATINQSTEPINTNTNSSEHTLITGLQNTTNITLAADGLLYFSYALGTRGVVGRVDPHRCRENGGCTHDQVEIVIYTELAAPLAGLTISPDMRLFIHSMFSPDIYWVQLPITVTENS
jgi:hypothetical protein